MDEPQLTTEVENVEVGPEKPDLDEVLESAFTENDSEKPMDVDSNTLIEEASTSADIETPETVADSNISEETAEKDVEEKAAVVVDASPANDNNPDESLDQVNFDKGGELDETGATETDQLDFTERSVNFSQLNVEHEDDDSNDAFNALKKSETDALQTPKEETEEVKDVDGDSKDSRDGEKQNQESEVTEVDPDVVVEPMDISQPEVESNVIVDDTIAPAEKEIEESHVATSTVDLDDDLDGDNEAALSEPAADTEDLPEVPDGKVIEIKFGIFSYLSNLQMMAQQRPQTKVRVSTKTCAFSEMRRKSMKLNQKKRPKSRR